MPIRETPDDSLLTTIKEIDRLYDAQADEEVRELLWELLTKLQEYRRRRDVKDRKTA